MQIPTRDDPRHSPPVLIVTGASAGIGAAGARAGDRIVVNYSAARTLHWLRW